MVKVNLGTRCSKVWSRAGSVYATCLRLARPGYRRCAYHARQDTASWQRATHYLVEVRGLCRTCRGPRENPFRTNCNACREEAVDRAAAQAARNRAAGRCKCGGERIPGTGRCAKCKARDDRRNAAVGEQRRRKREARALVAARRDAGLCTQCGARAVEGRTLCEAHLRDHAARSRKSYAKTMGRLKSGHAEDDLF